MTVKDNISSYDNNLTSKILVSLLIIMAPFSMGPITIISSNYLYIMFFIALLLLFYNLESFFFNKKFLPAKFTFLSILFALSFFTSMFFGPEYKNMTDYTIYKSSFTDVMFNISLFVPVNLLLTYLIYQTIFKLSDILFYLNVFLYSGLIINLFSMFALLNGLGYDPYGRLGLTFEDANYLGRFEVFIITLSIIYIGFSKRKMPKLFIAVNSLIALIILLMSFSRAALLTFVITLTIIILFVKSKIFKVFFIALNFFVFSYLIVFVALKRGVLSAETGVLSSFLDISNSTRLGLNYAALDIFLDYPIFGIGYHNFYNIYINYDYVPDFIPISLSVSVVHSWFFSLLAEQGILGAVPFCILTYYIFKELIKNIRTPLNDEFKFIAICLFTLMFVFVFNGLFFPVFFSEVLFPILFGLSGGFLKLTINRKNRKDIPLQLKH